jgi:hypothetical protein
MNEIHECQSVPVQGSARNALIQLFPALALHHKPQPIRVSLLLVPFAFFFSGQKVIHVS